MFLKTVDVQGRPRIARHPPNNRMQPDFGKLRLPQPLMRALVATGDI